MAKIVGTEDGHFVQAAAGGVEELLTPVGLMTSVAALVGGWTIGAAVGSSLKEGQPLLEPLPFEEEGTDGQAMLSMAGFTLGGVVSVEATKQMVAQYGWKNVLLYSGGLTAFVVVVRAARGEL